ncbi:MAG: hypothetical protein LBD04_07245 [Synergistaceae bacterium]|jgi:hypothetical protein|nr:hypothetical protein [Synergistaceae bacterium]
MSEEERDEVYRYIFEKKRQADTEKRIKEIEKILEGLNRDEGGLSEKDLPPSFFIERS